MTSWVVADSGLYLTIVLQEPHAVKAAALVEMWKQLDQYAAAPYLFRYELVSVIRKHIARGTLTLKDGHTALQGLFRYPVEIFTDEALLQRAFELANFYNRPNAYDATYLALAEHLGCEFWTADLKLFNAVSSQLEWVKWIGDYVPPQEQNS
ncbi:MAG: type II toxin-antitoxin system VapC family toxin [Anaerolineae bacterium]|nr:type II toxin-antitoxin system VapC family toxin [Anaerolineae bacterium]